MEELGGLFLLFERFVHQLAHGLGDVRREAEGAVEVDDGIFDGVTLDVARVAEVLLLAPAEEVAVPPAVTVGPLHDHPRLDACVMALATPQAALEVVVVPSLALTRTAALIEDGLGLLEELVANQPLVSAGDEFSVVGYVADVVRVAEQLGQLGRRDRAGGKPCRFGSQASPGQLVDQGFEAVLAAGVQLERCLDEWSSLWIQDDNPNVASFRQIPSVEVAEWRSTEGATAASLGGHLVGDVRTVGLGLVLANCMHDDFDHVTLGTFPEIHDCRNNSCSVFGQVPLGDGCVDTVSEDPVELVNDYVVDVLMTFNPSHHFLKDRSVLDARRRTPRFYELLQYLGAK